jgi:hypothetical protein
MRGIFLGDRRIGTVAKFVGNKPAERWVAWSIHPPRPAASDPHQGERRGFPRKRDAMAWLQAKDAEEPR